MKKLYLLLVLFLCCQVFGQSIDLTGKWDFQLDPQDTGVKECWFNKKLNNNINLPGSTISEGKGEKPSMRTKWVANIPEKSIYYTGKEYEPYHIDSNFKVSFFLQPETYYQGAAWYQKEITVSQEFEKKPLQLFLERCHWQSTVWIDGKEIGSCNSLGTPHTLLIRGGLSTGNHVITIRVDNRINEVIPGPNSHSVSDHTQGNWNGIVGQMYIKALPGHSIDSLYVHSDLNTKTLSVRFDIHNWSKGLNVLAEIFGKKYSAVCQGRKVEINIPLPENAIYWDEFNPHLYNLELLLSSKKGIEDRKNIEVGLRSIENRDGDLYINGHPAFMRGTLNCAQFPRTGYPATDKAEWIREFTTCKNYGLNHIRFHSWCPPEAAFEAADELGLYLYVECSSWSENIGSGEGIDSYIMDEAKRMLYNFGNHPSFCFITYGNEPGGKTKDEYLTNFVSYFKSVENRMLIASSAGWPQMEINDFNIDPRPRIQLWGIGTRSIINSHEPSSDFDFAWYCQKYKQLVISHEVGQWCVYPNFNEIKKYTGPYKAHNFEIFKDLLEKHGMGDLSDKFFMASGKLQTLCYKADIEAALRSKGQDGYELLGLQDFSGQGSAIIGALDAFWDEKPYTSAKEYKEFQNSVVPLVVMKKFIFTDKDTLVADIQLANYYKELKNKSVSWRILDSDGKSICNGMFNKQDFGLGNCLAAGTIKKKLKDFCSPKQYRLEVSIDEFTNHWDFWVYPSNVNLDQGNVYLTDTLNEEAINKLKKGGNVLLSIKKGHLSPDFGGKIPVGFSSIFWNTDWTNGQPPYTLGILCNPSHKALSKFPTDYYSNYQWFDAMTHSGAVRLDSLGYKGEPIVRLIDDWFTSRPIALLLEAKAYNGKIIISGIDFFTDIKTRTSGKELLYSILEYMKSKDFNPTENIDLDKLEKIEK